MLDSGWGLTFTTASDPERIFESPITPPKNSRQFPICREDGTPANSWQAAVFGSQQMTTDSMGYGRPSAQWSRVNLVFGIRYPALEQWPQPMLMTTRGAWQHLAASIPLKAHVVM